VSMREFVEDIVEVKLLLSRHCGFRDSRKDLEGRYGKKLDDWKLQWLLLFDRAIRRGLVTFSNRESPFPKMQTAKIAGVSETDVNLLLQLITSLSASTSSSFVFHITFGDSKKSLTTYIILHERNLIDAQEADF
jgi:hypothetical protein